MSLFSKVKKIFNNNQRATLAKDETDQIKRAERYNISYKLYKRKHLYDLTDSELLEYRATLDQRLIKKHNEKEFYLDIMQDRSGLTRDELLEDMFLMKKRGLPYKQYALRHVYELNETERVELLAAIKTDQKNSKNTRRKEIQSISEDTGWSIGKVYLEKEKAELNCNCTFEDYLGFKMYNMDASEQRKYVTLGEFDKIRIKYNRYKTCHEIFDNKRNFNIVFSDYNHRTWFTNDGLTYEDFCTAIDGLTKLIIKPLSSTQGIGIHAVECNVSEDDNKKVYDHIMSLDASIIEECIVQDDRMAEFCHTSINTVRILTINHNGHSKVLHSFFRMGNGGVADNFHANGLAAGVNLETGRLETDGIDKDRNVFTHSPSTGKKIKGFQIPHWEELIETSKQLAQVVEDGKLIGWDFAVTKNGYELIEGNPGASYYVPQLTSYLNGVGLRDIMVEPYL